MTQASGAKTLGCEGVELTMNRNLSHSWSFPQDNLVNKALKGSCHRTEKHNLLPGCMSPVVVDSMMSAGKGNHLSPRKPIFLQVPKVSQLCKHADLTTGASLLY